MKPADREVLRVAMGALKSARDESMAYFQGRREEVEAGFEDCNEQMGAWRRHLDEVLYAGRDPIYNRHKEREEAAAGEWEKVFGVVAGKYPWLAGSLSFFSGFGDTDGRVDQVVENAWTDAFNAFFREKHEAEIAALRKELEDRPQEICPSVFPVGAVVFSEIRGMPGTFRITRHTHKGKRTFAINGAGEEVRLPAGRSGDGYLSPGSGYRLVSQEWADRNAALNALWISEREE